MLTILSLDERAPFSAWDDGPLTRRESLQLWFMVALGCGFWVAVGFALGAWMS